MALVLVTGGSGEVARGVVPFLEREFALRFLDLAPAGSDPHRLQVDLLDWEALAGAMRGAEAVLHLAVASGRPEFVPCLLEMAEVEWEHEAYFRGKVESHWLHRVIRVWPAIPPKESIRAGFALRNPGWAAEEDEPVAV